MSAKYVNVLLPIKLTFDLSYIVPEEISESVVKGSYVSVPFGKQELNGVVIEVLKTKPHFKGELKELSGLLDMPPLSKEQIEFIEWVADYYMCTMGEVFRAAVGNKLTMASAKIARKRRAKSIKEGPTVSPIVLSKRQNEVLEFCAREIRDKKPVLIKGVTGSGKTEIYLELANQILSSGKSVLFLVPEIAMSRQLTERVTAVFGEKVLVFHSGVSASSKREIREMINNGSSPKLILGLRSALFLPYRELGLIIIDEEHDSSFKQSDPAPRYNARDAALMLAKIYDAAVVMGSATPSLESLYNCYSNKFSIVELNQKYHSSPPATVEIIDTIKEEREEKMMGLFAIKSIEAIKERLARGEQILIFRNRRSYAPMVQCLYCGEIPYCPNCNVPLNYHKRKNSLTCHYCNYSQRFNTICTSCGKPGLKERGSGTEMIEEHLRRVFPNTKIERFDAETTTSKVNEGRILKGFADGEIEILVGTQMISKGFDFHNLTLIVVVHGDSLFIPDDFRASERAMQLLVQLSGRAGRRDKRGHIIIQTARSSNPLFLNFLKGDDNISSELADRRRFDYPPFSRLIRISLKHPNSEHLNSFANEVVRVLPQCGVEEFSGPVPPLIERVRKEYILNIWIKLSRDPATTKIKNRVRNKIEALLLERGGGVSLSFDPDPQ